ncbi:Stp1/IreP family PP2C-type Ser/Thr phosphatase [Lysinibacter sp. HNR]|uniref:Stp1/IreP family PP2C-type Ser/Thr phosphatase n=1 Tax=Lysinibacter sp. HNR TaxID=3031408 RepID=UPI002434E370|nr:Stp1/IreP family PP2C-type Ser/Thr phosphatase [Lysinibacter sp. HNR]WGD37364.1 Stp1/IreP family PP2C-type Ser/Thr phosphatase [Lysinibacter sp. HNR]
MTVFFSTAASSHVGMVRANNQDSGYSGQHMFVVADGMGGHAGGDVASALTIKKITDLDREFDKPEEATESFREKLLDVNKVLSETVYEHPELAGMGTTVSGLIAVGDQLALGHIGDSRIYLLRGGELSQITEDHTFVQRLVESGRITEEEAKTHPRRSVLMRVLGDVDSSPEIDTMVFTAQPDDVWLLCSDGLSSYVSNDEMYDILVNRISLESAVDKLIEKSLVHGAPDNVTAILVEAHGTPQPPLETKMVGAAALPIAYGESDAEIVQPGGWLRGGRRIAPVPESHFEPGGDEYLDEIIAESKRRVRQRRLFWFLSMLLVLIVLVSSAFIAYQWTQTRFFVGTNGSTVIIYRGVQQDIGPISLSSVYEDTGIPVKDLGQFDQQRLTETISADSLENARKIVTRLEDVND